MVYRSLLAFGQQDRRQIFEDGLFGEIRITLLLEVWFFAILLLNMNHLDTVNQSISSSSTLKLLDDQQNLLGRRIRGS